MSDALPLGLDAVDLLLSIAESPGMAISSTALDDFYKAAGTELVVAGALKSDDFETVVASQADHDDAMVSLTWSSELGGYAHFSPAIGLVRIDADRLRRFKLDILWFHEWLASLIGFGTGARQVCLIPDRLWDLGDIWLGATKRTRRRIAIYLARRLTEPETVTQLAAILRMHSHRPAKVILTTTNDLDLARIVISDTCPVLAIKTCTRAGIENFELDPGIICSAAYSLRVLHGKLPIQADAEFRVIRVADRQFRFRGDKQRQVVGFLYQRWLNGDGPISIPIMLEELEWGNTKRLRDLFKGHADWQGLIGQKDGACWLRFDELLTEGEPMADRP
jgi:hypothetical protein